MSIRRKEPESKAPQTRVLSGDRDVRTKVAPALKAFSSVVGATAGPCGRLVAIHKSGNAPHLTKDGLTVASAYGAEGFEGVAVDMIRQSAIETGRKAGDGTTTATVLSAALYEAVGDEDRTRDELVHALQEVESKVLGGIQEKTVKVTSRDELYGVAYTSSNGDESIATPIADAFMELGPTGAITVEEDRSRTDVGIQWIEGSTFASGFTSPYFVASASNRVEFENPFIWFSLTPLERKEHVVPVMEAVAGYNQSARSQGQAPRPLLIVCDKISDEALSLLLVNNSNGALPCCAVNSPYLGTMRTSAIRDLATVCGASPTARTGLTRDNALESLGGCGRAIIEPKLTSLFEPKGDKAAVGELIADISKRLESEIEEAERAALQKRISNLRGKAAVLKIGGSTHSELVERKDRADDALASARWALLEGICPGAGATLLSVAREVDMPEELREAFCAPVKNVFYNYASETGRGDEAESIYQEAIEAAKEGKGLDIRSGEVKDDLVAAGVIDSSYALREAVRSAISSALALAKMRAIILGV